MQYLFTTYCNLLTKYTPTLLKYPKIHYLALRVGWVMFKSLSKEKQSMNGLLNAGLSLIVVAITSYILVGVVSYIFVLPEEAYMLAPTLGLLGCTLIFSSTFIKE